MKTAPIETKCSILDSMLVPQRDQELLDASSLQAKRVDRDNVVNRLVNDEIVCQLSRQLESSVHTDFYKDAVAKGCDDSIGYWAHYRSSNCSHASLSQSINTRIPTGRQSMGTYCGRNNTVHNEISESNTW